MLHHYNYSTTLSQFLSYHQLEEQNVPENEHSTSSSLCDDFKQHLDSHCKSAVVGTGNKSFTIAAILGLKNDEVKNAPADLSVVNLSVHPTETDRSLVSGVSRLQLPVRHGSSAVAVTGHYSVGHGCPTNRHAGRYQISSFIITM